MIPSQPGWADGDSGNANGDCRDLEMCRNTEPLGKAIDAKANVQMHPDSGNKGDDWA